MGLKPLDCLMNQSVEIDKRESMLHALARTNWIWQYTVTIGAMIAVVPRVVCCSMTAGWTSSQLTFQSAKADLLIGLRDLGSWCLREPVTLLLNQVSWTAVLKHDLRMVPVWQPSFPYRLASRGTESRSVTGTELTRVLLCSSTHRDLSLYGSTVPRARPTAQTP